MKRKFLSVIICLMLGLSSMFMFTACKEKPKTISKEEAVAAFDSAMEVLAQAEGIKITSNVMGISEMLCIATETGSYISLHAEEMLEEQIGVDKDGQEMNLYDIIPQDQEKDPDFIVERKVIIEEILKIMKNNLSTREYEIICLRYGMLDRIERTQQEVANMLDISRSYISRIETKALEILRKEFFTKRS